MILITRQATTTWPSKKGLKLASRFFTEPVELQIFLIASVQVTKAHFEYRLPNAFISLRSCIPLHGSLACGWRLSPGNLKGKLLGESTCWRSASNKGAQLWNDITKVLFGENPNIYKSKQNNITTPKVYIIKTSIVINSWKSCFNYASYQYNNWRQTQISYHFIWKYFRRASLKEGTVLNKTTISSSHLKLLNNNSLIPSSNQCSNVYLAP